MFLEDKQLLKGLRPLLREDAQPLGLQLSLLSFESNHKNALVIIDMHGITKVALGDGNRSMAEVCPRCGELTQQICRFFFAEGNELPEFLLKISQSLCTFFLGQSCRAQRPDGCSTALWGESGRVSAFRAEFAEQLFCSTRTYLRKFYSVVPQTSPEFRERDLKNKTDHSKPHFSSFSLE